MVKIWKINKNREPHIFLSCPLKTDEIMDGIIGDRPEISDSTIHFVMAELEEDRGRRGRNKNKPKNNHQQNGTIYAFISPHNPSKKSPYPPEIHTLSDN